MESLKPAARISSRQRSLDEVNHQMARRYSLDCIEIAASQYGDNHVSLVLTYDFVGHFGSADWHGEGE